MCDKVKPIDYIIITKSIPLLFKRFSYLLLAVINIIPYWLHWY